MDRAAVSGDLETALRRHETKPLLRFVTCGSVDDGKSTLIGRLLHETNCLFDDQLTTLGAESARDGRKDADLDYALLLDGLEAEREQGITIDVAYRYFDTERAKFVVADCPGHEQYTRNMATGASTATLAIVLVDARKGVLTQTRRHSYIVSLLGIRRVILAVNKMDLVGFDREIYELIAADYRALAATLGIEQVSCIPLSAKRGDNLTSVSSSTPWYSGPALLEALHSAAETETEEASGAFRLAVQWVCRPHQDFRGFAGTLAGGAVEVGDEVVALPSGRRSRVSGIRSGLESVERAEPGQPVILALADEIDVSRGDLLAGVDDPPEVADQFAVHVLWMDERPLLPGRPYWIRLGTAMTGVQVTAIRHKVDVNSQEHLATRRLELNEVGACHLALERPIPFSPYASERTLGSFILIDRQTNGTVGAGVVDHALRRAANVHWQHLDVDRATRAAAKGQSPACLWFTGLSGAGKSTIANLVDKRLHALGYHTFLLDGDNVRHGLNRDLGFTEEDRVENIRRVAEVARLMTDAGLIVLVSFISPFRADREMARGLFSQDEFLEIFVDVPLEVAEARDTKGLYAKARAGLIPNFTGIGSPYERPESPELHLDADSSRPEELVAEVLRDLFRRTGDRRGPEPSDGR